MTAMCDVAFLLLSFFILTTKFKPDEALSVITPNSVSSKVAPEKDFVMVTIDKEGKVYFSLSDQNGTEKSAIIDAVNTDRNLNLTAAQKAAFKRNGSYVGVPFSQLGSLLNMSQEDLKGVKMTGIPVTDSTNNELMEWMHAAASTFQGRQMNLLVKGDNSAKYPSFQGVINAFKKNDLMKFQMITNPQGIPPGSELSKKYAVGKTEND
jgi:biopolymer transport protein ExbD